MIHSHQSTLQNQLQNLRVFLSVADARSITGAAEQIFKAPSAISRSISELEHCIGASLFERRPRGIILNAFGEAVLLRGRLIAEEIRCASEEFQRSKARNAASQAAVINLLFNGRKLELLILLATARSISATASLLRMTQAGASMALSRMEAVVGQPLFTRGVTGLAPTAPTSRLVMHSKRVFAELRHLQSDLSAITGKSMGSVVVGTTYLGRTHHFPSAIADTVTRHPGIRVTCIENSYEQLELSLRNGDVDIVFGALQPGVLSQGLVPATLFVDQLSVMARAGHPLARRKKLSLSDLVGESWILPRPNALGRPQVDKCFRALGLTPPVPAVETSDPATLRQLLCASDMLAATVREKLAFELQAGVLVELPLVLEGTKLEVGFITRDGVMLPPAALAVLEAVRHQIGSRSNI